MVRRSARGFLVLVVAPAVLVVIVVLPSLALGADDGEDVRNFGVFFGSFAVVLGGLLILASWTLVGAANASARVPGAAAGWLGQGLCLFILVPLGVAAPLLLFRRDGRSLKKWFGHVGPRDSEREGRPPSELAPLILIPCGALLSLAHPMLRVWRPSGNIVARKHLRFSDESSAASPVRRDEETVSPADCPRR